MHCEVVAGFTRKKFPCSDCEKSCNSAAELRDHQRTHTGERPFKCSFCDKRFALSGTLVRHERLHTGITPYHCSDCGKTFAQQWTLTTHMRTHTGEKPYSCTQCDKSFVAPGELRRHTRIHTGEKPYTCSDCGRHFSLAGTLRNHRRSCTHSKSDSVTDVTADVTQASADESSQEGQASCISCEVPQPDNASLLPRRLSCSITKAVLILGCLLLLLFGGWLLHTIYWLRSTSSQAHRAPAPGQASGPVLQAEVNNTVITARSNACSIIPEGWRFDCYPERGVVVNRELCEARNCCFIPASSSARSKSRKNGIPWCFYPPDFPSYSLVSLNDTSIGLKGALVKDVKTYYPGDILTLEMEIRHETDTRLHVRVSEEVLVL
ncbi:hypothetical protein GOODEAATRI_009752 [Goodea atripinnis]|uniref:Uncharacterized protein n=1 Tax=Goodea atripinnis TaxID=208336 RepID=A0ABV0NT61_9TELE